VSDWLWWRDGVIYQIYPRSFMDSNGDGVGDLEGIRCQLDHLSWLGVDAIWLSPCFPSPMKDFGYDVADYCDIDPLFGSLADFDRLLAEAHRRNIRVILDWVPNHTSDLHAWFQESRRDRENPKRDWYVWRDAKPNGEPPNNWNACFGGPSWERDPATGQLYLHSFLKEQPDLNWRNPEVERAMHEVLRFWLDRGVDGFRIDVVQRLAKDPALRDNPAGTPLGGERPRANDENHPDVHAILRRIRAVLDGYPERMAVGEVYLLDPLEVARYYGRGDELHLAFNFNFTFAPWSAAAFRNQVEVFERAVPPEGWPDVVLSNHDNSRHATRFDDPTWGEARARVAAMMLLTLRGTPFLYYGEEIGMRDVPIPDAEMQDPLAWNVHPKFGRDPERSPMQWSAGPGAGFTTGARTWLPIGSDADVRNVAAQRGDPRSLLALYRDLIALRRATPALHRGDYRSLSTPEDVFAFERRDRGSRAVVALNFASEPRSLGAGSGRVVGGLHTTPGGKLPSGPEAIELGPYEGVVLLLAS
jgi:alpha-glucosidase